MILIMCNQFLGIGKKLVITELLIFLSLGNYLMWNQIFMIRGKKSLVFFLAFKSRLT